jgi:single-strand DNA-binding protein
MASVNKVILVGNLGADPDVKYTASGKCVAEIRVATSFKSGENETTEWHRVIAWDTLGENAGKYLSKGKSVYVEGRIQTRSYDDKDGNKRYVTEVVAERMQFLSPKAENTVEPEPAAKKSRKRAAVAADPAPEADFGD